jgi:hypothetical protein
MKILKNKKTLSIPHRYAHLYNRITTVRAELKKLRKFLDPSDPFWNGSKINLIFINKGIISLQ